MWLQPSKLQFGPESSTHCNLKALENRQNKSKLRKNLPQFDNTLEAQ